MLTRLAINMVTRGRADLCIATLDKTMPNISMPETRLMVSLDHDDEESIKKLSLWALDHKNVTVDVRKRDDSFGAKFNRITEWDADVYMGIVDYGPHVTPAFDKIILEAASVFPDGIGAVYTDYMPNGSFTKLNAPTRGLIDAMGFFYPPYFPYWFIDHWFDDICRMTERYIHVPINVDIGNRPGTQDKRDPAFWALLFDALHLRRRAQALKIIEALDEPEWRKRVLRSRIPLIEHRSRLVNEAVRAMPPERLTGLVDDERYARIKRKGLEMLGELIPELQAAEEQK